MLLLATLVAVFVLAAVTPPSHAHGAGETTFLGSPRAPARAIAARSRAPPFGGRPAGD